MPWLINNSTGCKYWTYSYDQKLLNLINNHHKKYSSKSLKIKKHQACNSYIIDYNMSHFTDEEFNNLKNNKNTLKKIIKQHLGNNHIVKIYYKTSNLNTRGFK